MKKFSCLMALALMLAGCVNMNNPSAPIDNVIGTVGGAFGNISGQKPSTP